MSEFPVAEHFRTSVSDSVRAKLSGSGFPESRGPVIRKQKAQYLYDLDDNKYCDFHLNHGGVILGHSQKTVTQFIKGGLSTGLSSGLPNKFHPRLIALFSRYCPDGALSCFSNFDGAVIRMAEKCGARTVGVTSAYLEDRLLSLKTFLTVERARPGASYDLLLYEPVDFDRRLDPVSPGSYRFKTACAVENRTFYRFECGFLSTLREAHHVLCANACANGMESCVVLSREGLPGENLSVYQSVAVLETVKAYGRKLGPGKMSVDAFQPDPNCFAAWKGSAFALTQPVSTESLLKSGIYMEGTIGFVSLEHTAHDWGRLTQALKKLL